MNLNTGHAAANGRRAWMQRDGTGGRNPVAEAVAADIMKTVLTKGRADIAKAIADPDSDVSKEIENLARAVGEKAAADAVHAYAEKHALGAAGSVSVDFVTLAQTLAENRNIAPVVDGRELPNNTLLAHLGQLTRSDQEWLGRYMRDPVGTAPELRQRMVKSISSDNTAVPGGTLNSLMAYTGLALGDAWLPEVDLQTATGGIVKSPIIGAITFTDEDSDNQSRTESGGTLATVDTELKTGATQQSASLASMNDVPGMMGAVAEASAEGAGTWHGGKVYAAVRASIIGANGFGEVKTGRTDVPTDANILTRADQVLEKVEARYRGGASWHMSRAYEKGLHAKAATTSGDQIFRVEDKITYFRGYPVVLNDHLKAAADDDIALAFGNWRRGIRQFLGSPMILAMISYENQLGRATFFSSIRGAAAVIDAKACAGMSVGS